MLLTAQGNDVELAYDGRQALAVAEQFEPQVVFLDIGLPKLDGYEVARTLRSDARFADLVMVAVTGYGQERDRRRTQEAGFDFHLVKPATLGAIQEVLASI